MHALSHFNGETIMHGPYVAHVIEVAICACLIAIVAFVMAGMLNGRIILTGLLHSRKGSGFHFHRLQMVAVTSCFAAAYLIAAMAKAPGDAMPNVPNVSLVLLLGSHGVYLAGKAGL